VTLWSRFGWVVLAAVAGVLTVVSVVVLPADRELSNVGELLFRISPLVFGVLAASMFPQRSGQNLVLLALLVVVFMGAVDTFVITRILEYAHTAEADRPAAFPKLYQMTILLDAFVLFAICIGYRLGGAKTYKVARLGIAGTLVVTSGLNDLTFFYTHDWGGARPSHLDAPHIAVFVGGDPTPATAIAFCVVNLLVAAAVIVVPWFVVRRRQATRSHVQLSSNA
jgi:hypothetical protein